jgi:hypothetical protein
MADIYGRARDKAERVAAELAAKGKREAFSVGGVGVTVATVVAFGAGFVLGMLLG